MSDSGKKRALSLSPAPCFLPDLAGRYERIVSEAEHALLVDVQRVRESLRDGEFIAEGDSQVLELKGKYKQWWRGRDFD